MTEETENYYPLSLGLRVTVPILWQLQLRLTVAFFTITSTYVFFRPQ